ncbi:hypothetical protein BX600DRAFT_470271 [Xylariales sp. PMI_506]|nr:hypothetical protein BX600DRAFT_470271 [Xylariales sp. PMI_506]
MGWASTISNITSTAFGSLCILSSLPFVGIPFPTRDWAVYYAGKNQWLSKLSGGRLTPIQAGYCSALLRITVGTACIFQATRDVALLVNGAIVIRGTFLAHRDGRPMRPQWTMLGAIGLCFFLGRL